MTENFSERIENALNDIQKIQLLFKQRYGEECFADKEIEEVLKSAKSEHEELQQYRSIGTVEEFQTATEIRNSVTPEISSHFYICPRCKTRKNIMMKSKFCSECGQAFGWKEKNDE